MPEIEAFFMHPVSYAPLREEGHISAKPFLPDFGGVY